MEIRPTCVAGRRTRARYVHMLSLPWVPTRPVWTPSAPTFLHRGVSAPLTPGSGETTCGVEGGGSRRAPDPALRTRDRNTTGPSAQGPATGDGRAGLPLVPLRLVHGSIYPCTMGPGPPAEELLRACV